MVGEESAQAGMSVGVTVTDQENGAMIPAILVQFNLNIRGLA